MKAKPLLSHQPVTRENALPSLELVEIIQRIVEKLAELEARIEALEP